MTTVLSAILLFLAATLTADSADPSRIPAALERSKVGSVVEADRQRIMAHLEAVEARLRRAPIPHLSESQRQAREANLDKLRDYRLRGEFPHNHDFSERRPYFRDRHGTLCAMAYLIEQSGASELVDRVARDANNAYVMDLAADPELADWLAANGMTATEAALVQPAYEPQPDEPFSVFDAVDENYPTWALGAIAVDALALALNHPSAGAGARSEVTGALAVAAGITGTTLGVFGLGRNNAPDEILGIANIAMGVVTSAVGVQRILRGFSDGPGPVSSQGAGSELRMRPILLDRRPGLGVSFDF